VSTFFRLSGFPSSAFPVFAFPVFAFKEPSMNHFANIWNHPKTSASGVLIAIATIAGVLTQQGVKLGNVGSGTAVSLVGALASAVLGLLARDPAAAGPGSGPGSGSGSSSVKPVPVASGQMTKLGAWALIALLLQMPMMTGCSGTKVAQDIVNWTPALQSAVGTVDSTAALLAPTDAPIFAAATVGFDAAANLLTAQARAYLANPSASLLTAMQSQIVTFEQQVNASLLAALKIANPASQKSALTAIQGVATIVSAMLALVQSVSDKAAVAQMAAGSSIKLAAVQATVGPYLDAEPAQRIVAAHYGESMSAAQGRIEAAKWELVRAGF
jgi:CheY-like chemotaxis protein